MKRARFRPVLDQLEERSLMVFGLVTGMTLTPNPPRLGNMVNASLKVGSPGPFVPSATTWTWQVSYGGATSPLGTASSGGVLGASFGTPYPGTETIVAVTSYSSSNPTVPPPAPTTFSSSVVVPAPSSAAKGGGVGVPTAFGTGIWMTDLVLAGGDAIGPLFAGVIQESIPPVYYTGGGPYSGTLIAPGTGWWPPSPASTFYFSSYDSSLHDLFNYFTTPSVWGTIPVGRICAFTQALRFAWTMPTSGGGSASFTAPLPSISWAWSKVDATHWQVN